MVDERARAACATAVHSLFSAAGDEDYFSVLAAELDSRVDVGVKFANGNKRGLNLLYEVNAATLRKPKTRASRN